MKPLGPDEGINRLRHPDCRFCGEYELLLRGVMEENRQLKADKVTGELALEWLSNAVAATSATDPAYEVYKSILEQMDALDQAGDNQ